MGQLLPIRPPIPDVLLRARDVRRNAAKKLIVTREELDVLLCDIYFASINGHFGQMSSDGAIGSYFGKPIYLKDGPRIRCQKCGGDTLGLPCDYCGVA
jgi:hypothetical protein